MPTRLQRNSAAKRNAEKKATAAAAAAKVAATQKAAKQSSAAQRQLALEKKTFAPSVSVAPSQTSPSLTGGSSSTSTNIAFKAGLSDAQKSSISSLTTKPADQWSATDKANWSYATNGSPLPGASTGAASGIDQTGWTPAMIQSYNAMQGYVDSITQSGKVVNPDITFDEDTIARFTNQAKTELGDYYGPLFDQTQKDIATGLQRIGEDLSAYQDKLGKQFGQQLESTQESYARRGLNFSSDRDKAESNLASDYNNALNSQTQQAQRSAFDLGTAGERKLGSSFFPMDTADYSYGGSAQLGTPGQYGFSAHSNRSRLFNPSGNVKMGSLQSERTYAERARANELKNASREFSSSFYL